ncbi:hypothetical protein D918_04848 [Trichuris suis]|nr:hypothetical protein D918_04848 [Trichuris suis]
MSYLSPLPQYLIPFPRYRTIEPSFTCPTISLPYCDTISRHRRPLLHLIDPSKYCFRAPDTYRQRPVVPHCDKLGNMALAMRYAHLQLKRNAIESAMTKHRQLSGPVFY